MKTAHDFSREEWERAARSMGVKNAQALLNEYISLPETQGRLVEAFGPDWTLEDAIRLMWPRRAKVRDDPGARAAKLQFQNETPPVAPDLGDDDADDADAPPPPAMEAGEFEDKVAQRIERYHLFFKDLTPNDEAAIQDLASTEVELEHLHSVMRHAQMNNRTTDLDDIAKTIQRYSRQAQSLQRQLHIDRATREREAEGSSAADEALSVIDAAGEWAEQHAVQIVHKGCQAPDRIGKSDILFGLVLWDFMEIGFTLAFKCPRCGRPVTYTHTPSPEQLAAAHEPDWVAAEEAEYSEQEREIRRKQAFQEVVADDDDDDDESASGSI